MLGSIVNTFSNCFKIPELKSRLIFTMLVLAVCRLVSRIPTPGLNAGPLTEFLSDPANMAGGGLLGMFSLFTGGALEQCAIGSLGIMPYISATIIIQLLTAVIPSLSKLAREEGGRAKIVQRGRYLTVILCLGQGYVMALGWENPGRMFTGFDGQLVLSDHLWWYRIQTALMLTTGTLLLMWLGEQITERGVGNGVSLVITIGILARLPVAARSLWMAFFPTEGPPKYNIITALVLIILLVSVVAAVIAVTQAQRKIPVQHAQRAVGRKVYAGGTSFMPLRVNYAGVMPIIFAQAILMFPRTIFLQLYQRFDIRFFQEIAINLDQGKFFYMLVYGGMILFFSYFWVATQFNEIQIADDLKKSGGYIPGVRPGQETSKFLHRTMSRITLAGASFLVVIALIPNLMTNQMNIDYYVATFFGGTSILISVGVVLDTMRQIESHLMMRHYDGFLPKRRMRGRL